jgi:hypothetical protein
MYSAQYLEYEAEQRTQELRGALNRALWMEELQKERSESCRSRLARRLVTLGIRLDPQAASSAARMQPVRR